MKNVIKALCLFSSLIFSFFPLNAQSLTTQQVDHLFKMGQLWGHIKYFHPYLQYKTIAFDSAYAATVPKVLEAQTNADYAKALNEWLSILNDPITHVEISQKKDEQPFKADYQRRNNVGIITLSGNTVDWSAIMKKFQSFFESIPYDTALVLDCQDMTGDLSMLMGWSDFQDRLLKNSVSTLGDYSVAHSGFVSETGVTSEEYRTYFKTFSPRVISGKAQRDMPIVFIASATTPVPEVILAMRKVGKAVIISNENLKDYQNSNAYEFMDGFITHVRIKEPLSGNIKADWVNIQADKAALIDKAMAIIERNDFKPQKLLNNLPIEMIEKTSKYPSERFPTLGYRALSLAKIYSVINYFFPNKKLMSANWDSVVRQHIAPIVLAKDSTEYQLGVLAIYAHIQDGHGYVSGIPRMNIFMGGFGVSPMTGKVVEDKYIITRILDDSMAQARGIVKGDIILKRDGKDVFELIKRYKKHRAYSNEVTGTYYSSDCISFGADNTEGMFTIQKKNGTIKDIKLPFTTKLADTLYTGSEREKEPMLRFLTPNIGYVDLNRLESSAVDSMFEMFKNTKAIVFDMRGYPKGISWIIAPRLTNKKSVPVAKYTKIELDISYNFTPYSETANKETWSSFIENIPNPPSDKQIYTGKTVMLINEETQSQAEYTGMCFRAANGTQFIGSQTAGADGDVTNFTLPGNLTLYFSGRTVWYPDGKPTQQIGLVPDVLVKPTIKGIQARKDEVLERAIKYLETGK